MTLDGSLGLGLRLGLGGTPIALSEDEPFTNDFALATDGVDEFIRVPRASIPDVLVDNTPFSISLWVTENSAGWMAIGDNPGLSVYRLNPGVTQMRLRDGQGTSCIVNMGPPLGSWTHYLMTYDGDKTIKTWRNAASPAQRTQSAFAGTISNSDDWRMGRNEVSNYAAQNFDEVVYFPYALTQADAAELYNGGVMKSLAATSLFAKATHWWRMGDQQELPNVPDLIGNANAEAVNMDASNLIPGVPTS